MWDAVKRFFAWFWPFKAKLAADVEAEIEAILANAEKQIDLLLAKLHLEQTQTAANDAVTVAKANLASAEAALAPVVFPTKAPDPAPVEAAQ